MTGWIPFHNLLEADEAVHWFELSSRPLISVTGMAHSVEGSLRQTYAPFTCALAIP